MRKDRPTNAYFKALEKRQSERLKQCGLSAIKEYDNQISSVYDLHSTLYSPRYLHNRMAARESYQELLQRINRQSNGMF